MASTLTLLEIRTSVYTDGDLRSIRHTPTMVDTWINKGIKELWNILIAENQDLELKYSDISVVSGTVEYSLPTD
jgi:hypothetical protein